MISATPPPSIEVSLFGAVDAPSTSAKAKENLEKLETFLEGLSGRPGRRVAEREVRIRCPAGGELRLRRQMVDVVSSSSSSSSSPACSSPASAFDLSSAATEWTLTQAGPPLRGRGAATLAALARPVTGVVTPSAGAGGGGGVGGAGDLFASSSLSVLAPCSSGAGVEACVAGRHAPAFFASAGFALDFSSPSSGDGGGGGGGGGGGRRTRPQKPEDVAAGFLADVLGRAIGWGFNKIFSPKQQLQQEAPPPPPPPSSNGAWPPPEFSAPPPQNQQQQFQTSAPQTEQELLLTIQRMDALLSDPSLRLPDGGAAVRRKRDAAAEALEALRLRSSGGAGGGGGGGGGGSNAANAGPFAPLQQHQQQQMPTAGAAPSWGAAAAPADAFRQ